MSFGPQRQNPLGNRVQFPETPLLDPTDEKELLMLNADLERIFNDSQAIQSLCEDYVVKGATSENFSLTYPWDVTYRPADYSGRRQVPINDHALGQLCNRVGVPTSFVKKCIENEEYGLVHENVNTWLDRFGRDLFIREHDNRIRGILSTRYSVLDTPDVLDVLFGSDLPLNDFKVKGYFQSPERFHLRLIEDRPLLKKDDLFPGVQIDSSDVGRSTLRVQFLIFKLVCTNGMVAATNDGIFFQQKHVGITKDEFREGLSTALERYDEVREKVIPVIKAAKNEAILDETDTEEDLLRTIQTYTKFGEEQAKELLNVMEDRGYDSTKWGLANTLTDWAQKYTLERRLDMERLAGRLIAA